MARFAGGGEEAAALYRTCNQRYTHAMSQLNIHLTQEFEHRLSRLMRVRQIKTKSEAVRIAVEETLERSLESGTPATDFHSWIGLACKAPLNPQPRFRSDDDLWGD